MGNRIVYYGFRMDEETYKLVKRIAKDRGVDLADLLRELVRKELARLGFLSDGERKALGCYNDSN